MAIPSDLFTPESMLTLAGATVMTTVITNSFQYAFNWNPRWFGLVIAMIIAIVGVVLTGDAKFINYFVGVINGFLIYASSTGIMEMAGSKAPQPGPTGLTDRPGRRFMDKWYP